MAEGELPVSTQLRRAGRVSWDEEGCVCSCKSHCDQHEFHALTSRTVGFGGVWGRKAQGAGTRVCGWGRARRAARGGSYRELPARPGCLHTCTARVWMCMHVCVHTLIRALLGALGMEVALVPWSGWAVLKPP